MHRSFSGIAQLVEREPLKLQVLGSIPSSTVMMKTRKLYLGDLVAYISVAGNYMLGMIVAFDEAYTCYDIEWLCPRPMSHATWKTTQEYRNNYLDYRKKMK